MIQQADLEIAKSQIVEIIESRISLKNQGSIWRACCPFHQEKAPSFCVNGKKKLWHCFGCGAGGDVIDFIKQYHNVDFVDALQILNIKHDSQPALKTKPNSMTILLNDMRAWKKEDLEWLKIEYDALCFLSRYYKQQMAKTPPLEHEASWYTQELRIEERLDEIEVERREIVAGRGIE